MYEHQHNKTEWDLLVAKYMKDRIMRKMCAYLTTFSGKCVQISWRFLLHVPKQNANAHNTVLYAGSTFAVGRINDQFYAIEYREYNGMTMMI